MAIRGDAQIQAKTLFSAQLADNAGIKLSQLAQGLDVILRDGTVAMTADLDLGGKALVNLGAVTDASADNIAATVKYVKDKFNTIISPVQYKGTFDASAGLPADVKTGYLYLASVGGTIGGKNIAAGDMIVANKDVVGATAITDFDEIDNQQYVTAVAGKTGNITLEIADIQGLTAALSGKADTVHTHAIADTTGLQAALDNKASATHAHAISDVTGLQTALDGLATAVTYADDEVPTGTKDGVNKTFTLANVPKGGLQLFRNGVLQAKGTNYTIAALSKDIVFTAGETAPGALEELLAFYRY